MRERERREGGREGEGGRGPSPLLVRRGSLPTNSLARRHHRDKKEYYEHGREDDAHRDGIAVRSDDALDPRVPSPPPLARTVPPVTALLLREIERDNI
eukprot:scaffold114505_cov26-Tisochrysis_lutea.AAC.1